ncbi:MAG: hypothetical protein ABI700_12450 [Chloroflexota bacterium]
MLRAAGRVLLIILLITTVVGAVSAAPALQSGALLPAIATFSADTSTINYSDVEAGTAQVTLSWSTINGNGQYLVVLEAYFQNYWVSLAKANEALPLNGSRTVPVTLPQNFGSPTFRLTLKTSMGEVIGQQFVTLAYATPAQDAPGIVAFTTMAQSIDTNLLVQNNTRLVVSWEVQNRTPDTLITFEEVLPDGSTVSAEPQRRLLWLPSKGEGAVIPRPTAAKSDLVFRLSLVNVKDGTVYDQTDLTVPVMGNVVMAAAPSQNSQAQTNIKGNQISTFSAESATVPQGGNVVLNWDASGADAVQLLENAGGDGPTTLYIQLPPTGTMTLPVPEGSPDVTYTLRAQNADGTTSTGEVSVTSTDDQGDGG